MKWRALSAQSVAQGLTPLDAVRSRALDVDALTNCHDSTDDGLAARRSVEGVGWEMLFIAINDYARIAFTAMHADERTSSAVQFLRDAMAYCARLGATVRRLLTDSGSALRSRDFAAVCKELGVRHRFTRPYRLQTNGKAECFIESALREWANVFTYQHSSERTKSLDRWNHHYEWHLPRQGIGSAVPICPD